jgi:hypothetical protein
VHRTDLTRAEITLVEGVWATTSNGRPDGQVMVNHFVDLAGPSATTIRAAVTRRFAIESKTGWHEGQEAPLGWRTIVGS